jgi:hypothetical protein
LVKSVVSECSICNKFNLESQFIVKDTLVIKQPMKAIALDLGFLVPSIEGHTGFLIAMDVTSRFVMAKPFFKKDEVLEILFKIFTTEGASKFIMSDLGSEFTNKLVSKIKDKLKIVDHITSVAGFKIGLIERGIKTLKDKIKKLEKLNNWRLHLDLLCLAINLTSINNNGLYPFLLFRQRPFHFKDMHKEVKIQNIRNLKPKGI